MPHSQGAASAPAREVAHPGLQQVDIDLIDPSYQLARFVKKLSTIGTFDSGRGIISPWSFRLSLRFQ